MSADTEQALLHEDERRRIHGYEYETKNEGTKFDAKSKWRSERRSMVMTEATFLIRVETK